MKTEEKKYTSGDIQERFYSQDDAIRVHEMEIFYKPDILTITRKLLVKEYEIKVSQQDLKKELDVIDWVRSGEAILRPREWSDRKNIRYVDSNKERKHYRYLIDREEAGYSPNFFYFILPESLYKKNKERFKGLPYGVIEAQFFTTLKKPEKLHDDICVSEMMLWQICSNQQMHMSQMRGLLKQYRKEDVQRREMMDRKSNNG